MSQYINKTKIEEILRSLWKKDDGNNSEHRIYYNKALQEVQCRLDTIETKEVDLEKEISDYLTSYHLHIKDGGRVVFDNNDSPNFMCDIRHIAKHFFEVGLKAQKGE